MQEDHQKYMGFCCAYTPLPLLHAAGFVPYRLFPMGDPPDQAGSIMHDNLCPHVKRILDRALANDLPKLSGMIFMDSCESMRRLADAWQVVNESDRRILVDLPLHSNERNIVYLSKQLKGLANTLSQWAGRTITAEAVNEGILQYSQLAERLNKLDNKARDGQLSRSLLQKLINNSVTRPIAETLLEMDELENRPPSFNAKGRAPILVFGNVLPDPEALSLFEESGCLIVNMDTCTGARQHVLYDCDESKDPYDQLARSLLARPPCARSISPDEPDMLSRRVLESAHRVGAKGVVGHVMKFCDPYLARIPPVLKTLKAENLPYLILEGDCTLRSFGQHKTRIQAFAEILNR
jgi:benzoyl-CoA reductase subunit C